MDPPDNEKRKYENYNDDLDEKLYKLRLYQWITKACEISNGPVFLSFSMKWIHTVECIIAASKIDLIQRLYWRYTFGQANKTRYTPSIRPIYWLNKDTIYPENIKYHQHDKKSTVTRGLRLVVDCPIMYGISVGFAEPLKNVENFIQHNIQKPFWSV